MLAERALASSVGLLCVSHPRLRQRQAVDSKLQFIAEYLEHEESVAELCRWFGISRKTYIGNSKA